MRRLRAGPLRGFGRTAPGRAGGASIGRTKRFSAERSFNWANEAFFSRTKLQSGERSVFQPNEASIGRTKRFSAERSFIRRTKRFSLNDAFLVIEGSLPGALRDFSP
jgi:hypothetical protein